jgi:16S rRNA C967 or C1407 C5-methylase (RsmB/RsmF family)
MTFPQGFEARMTLDFGVETAERVIAAIEAQRPETSIRHNPIKPYSQRSGTAVTWEPMAEFLDERPDFSMDPLWHAGAYYVQEASSMLAGEIFRRIKATMPGPLNVLDLCAAPGGKSTHLLSVMDPDDFLVSNEVSRTRASVLHENITKWGNPNVMITQQDPARFAPLGAFFDVILVDAPCSGEGLWRRDADAVNEWSREAVQHCAVRQTSILNDIWPVLKPNGVLIYSTCTYNREENEAQLDHLISEHGAEEISFDLPADWGFVRSENLRMWRGLPGLGRGEGFAIGVVRKAEVLRVEVHRYAQDDSYGRPTLRRTKELFWPDLLPEGDWTGLVIGSNTVAVPAALESRMLALDGMRIVSAGHEMGDDRRPRYVGVGAPSSDRIHITRIHDPHWQRMYLKRESIPVDGPNGITLILAGEVPLGYGKTVNGRLNNWYPMEWRLRKSL